MDDLIEFVSLVLGWVVPAIVYLTVFFFGLTALAFAGAYVAVMGMHFYQWLSQ